MGSNLKCFTVDILSWIKPDRQDHILAGNFFVNVF